MDEALTIMSETINNNYWIAPLLSFLAGILTAFTPCSLSSVPLIIGYVGGYGANDTKRAFRLSTVFAIRNGNNFYSIRCDCCYTW